MRCCFGLEGEKHLKCEHQSLFLFWRGARVSQRKASIQICPESLEMLICLPYLGTSHNFHDRICLLWAPRAFYISDLCSLARLAFKSTEVFQTRTATVSISMFWGRLASSATHQTRWRKLISGTKKQVGLLWRRRGGSPSSAEDIRGESIRAETTGQTSEYDIGEFVSNIEQQGALEAWALRLFEQSPKSKAHI